MRIVRLANFVAPHSGGLRTSLAELGAGYLAAGHEPVLVIPGERDGDELTAQGRVITLRAPRVPFTGGYRVLWRRRRLARLLADLQPDALEVSDRTTLRWTGAWAREHGVPAVMVSHESVTALLKLTRLGLDRAVADWLNRRTARAYHRVICTTGWAAAEFGRIDAGNVVRVPLGVDLDTFSPRVWRVRAQYAGEGQILLVHCGRLSAEKRPQRSLTTLATLGAAGLPVRLVVAGDGPLRARLVRRATRTGLPVTFAGFLSGRADLAALLASADVAIAPGLPGALARPLARRMRAVNAAVDEVARRYGTVHLDVARDPATHERRYWSVDRLHPNERGHRLIACRFHALLRASGFPVGPGPDPEPSSPPPARLAEVHWMATKGTAWLVRRSRDLVPALVGLAVREWLGLGREEPEPETTEPKYPEPESTGPENMALERVNLNVLSKPSGNLRLYEC